MPTIEQLDADTLKGCTAQLSGGVTTREGKGCVDVGDTFHGCVTHYRSPGCAPFYCGRTRADTRVHAENIYGTVRLLVL